jgi:integrase/recombinase XerD
MPVRITTTVNKISSLHNSTNPTLLCDLYQYMKSNGASDSHQNNCLKTLLAFATFIGPNKSFYDITRKEQITAFLDTRIKSSAFYIQKLPPVPSNHQSYSWIKREI